MTLSLESIQHESAHEKLSTKLKPVEQTYNCRNNKAKFCLPITINSARTLEREMEKVRKEHQEMIMQNLPKTKSKASKDWHNLLVACGKRRFPMDSRNANKFVEVAARM